jgi:hypothetical protein
MKTTAQRLSEVYCRPKGEKEWGMFGLIDIGTNYAVWSVDGVATVTDCNLPELFTEIPVQHFIDLIENRIVAWRLAEDGFKKQGYGYIFYLKDIEILLDKHFEVYLQDNNDCEMYFDGCKTYTDLLTLIRLL